MSRSFKHTPVYQDQCTKRFGKRYANKVVRQRLKKENEVADNKSYRKMYDSWDISDYCFRTTFNDYKHWYIYDKETNLYYDVGWNGYIRDTYTEQELYNEWAKTFLRK